MSQIIVISALRKLKNTPEINKPLFVVSLARPVQTISEKSGNIWQPRGYIGNFDLLITRQSKHLCYYKKMLTFQQRDTRFGKKCSRKKRKHLSLLIYKSLTFIVMSGSGRFPSDIYIQPPKEFSQGVKHWIKFIKKNQLLLLSET